MLAGGTKSQKVQDVLRSFQLLSSFVLVSVYRFAREGIMARQHAAELLAMVREMEEQFGSYSVGLASAREAVRHILAICERLRATVLKDGLRDWLGAIERHAADICCLRIGSRPGKYLLSSTKNLRAQLLNDIRLLRLQIANI